MSTNVGTMTNTLQILPNLASKMQEDADVLEQETIGLPNGIIVSLSLQFRVLEFKNKLRGN
jgi:hypothetical protein